jgi:hypothetical protein
MTTPKRIQRKRVKGFDLQATSRVLNGLHAVSVTRPGQFGNPFKVGIWFRNISGDWRVWTRSDSQAFIPGGQQVESLIRSLELFKEYAEARAGRDSGLAKTAERQESSLLVFA